MTEYIVTLADDADPARVREALTRAGFAVDYVLKELNMVVGQAGAAVAERVRATPGVLAVEASSVVDIGPPDAPLH